MTFRGDVQLDPSQVEDRRGGGGLGRGLAVGGGGLGLLAVLLISYFLGIDPSSVVQSLPAQPQASQVAQGGPTLQECQRGSDANQREDCRVVGFVNSIQSYWQAEFKRRGGTYEPAKTVLFSQVTQTGCGTASSEVGPFYCPEDQTVYLDLSFFDELYRRFGANQGPLAEAYVIAHEYGHHVQNQIGALEGATTGGRGPNSGAVRVELQADCFAGVWARHATETGYIAQISQQDINDALSTAAAVGDDRIQAQTRGRVTPETWTHGSSEQRVNSFAQGYRTGDPGACSGSR